MPDVRTDALLAEDALLPQDAQPAISQPAEPLPALPALPLRNDTILGVCEGIGQDFGFHANWLRVPLAGMVMISPLSAFGIYFALGLAVLASRLLYPAPRPLAAPHLALEPQPRSADNQADEERLAA